MALPPLCPPPNYSHAVQDMSQGHPSGEVLGGGAGRGGVKGQQLWGGGEMGHGRVGITRPPPKKKTHPNVAGNLHNWGGSFNEGELMHPSPKMRVLMVPIPQNWGSRWPPPRVTPPPPPSPQITQSPISAAGRIGNKREGVQMLRGVPKEVTEAGRREVKGHHEG